MKEPKFQAWHKDESLFIPDFRCEVKEGDELISLNGYSYIVAVKRAGQLIGWADKDSKP